MELSNNWLQTQKALARAIRAKVLGDKEKARAAPSSQELVLARILQFQAAAPSALNALREGKLVSLGAQEQNGQVWLNARI